MGPEMRYYVVERDRLGEYGDERGSSREEAIKLLQSYEGCVVVICGYEVPFTLAEEPSEESPCCGR